MKNSFRKVLFSLFIFVGVLGGAFYYRYFIETPAFQVATIWATPGNYSDSEQKKERFIPFYYTVGAFQFDPQNLIPKLDYRRGSPLQFIHSIVWDNLKDARLEVRGPKTPYKDQTADTLRNCLTHMIFATEDVSACIRFRTQFLGREMREMKLNIDSPAIELRWFEIENPSLAENETPRGVYLSATGAKTREERYIFVLPKGTLQSWSFRSTLENSGIKDFETFIRSIKISESLEKNQILVDRELQKTRLETIQKINKPIEKITALAQVQTLLLSKISVSPGDIQAFLHLGGTARLMHAEGQAIGRYDLSAQARLLIEGALLYARGIDLKSDATFQLEKLAIEVRGRKK